MFGKQRRLKKILSNSVVYSRFLTAFEIHILLVNGRCLELDYDIIPGQLWIKSMDWLWICRKFTTMKKIRLLLAVFAAVSLLHFCPPFFFWLAFFPSLSRKEKTILEKCLDLKHSWILQSMFGLGPVFFAMSRCNLI